MGTLHEILVVVLMCLTEESLWPCAGLAQAIDRPDTWAADMLSCQIPLKGPYEGQISNPNHHLAMLTSSRPSVAHQFSGRRCATSHAPLRRGRLIAAAKQKLDNKRKQPVNYGNDWSVRETRKVCSAC